MELSQKGNLMNVHEKSKKFEHENCLIQKKWIESDRIEPDRTESDRNGLKQIRIGPNQTE